MNKKLLVTAGIVAATGAASVAGLAVANAAVSKSTSPTSGLVGDIATKFNLKEADVQAVVDQRRAEMGADRSETVKTEIATLVNEGRLTQDQADKINAKRAELEKEREVNRTSAQGLSRTERQAKMKEHRTVLEQWLKDNNIDSKYTYLLAGGFGNGKGMGGGHGLRRGLAE